MVDADLNLRLSRDGSFQVPGPWLFSNLHHLGFYVAAYRTPVGQPEDLEPVPDNLALIYAMEAGNMAFETFITLTTHLPAKLVYNEVYEFHTPDDKHFSVWLKRHGAEVPGACRRQERPIGDLTTLPLVSGEYMSAPGGHDGRIEISHPGCETPLVLDYHDAQKPARRPDAFVAFDEALDLLRQLIVTDGLAAHGPTFLTWVHWPVGAMLRLDGQHEKADALAEEAQAIAQQLAQPAPSPANRVAAPIDRAP